MKNHNGASVTLQGPAAYEIAGPMETRLHHGILTARIPESAIGFTVETSAMNVVDLGTAFGVSVNADEHRCLRSGKTQFLSRR